MTIQCKDNTVYDGKGQLIEDEKVAFSISAGVSNVTIKNYKFRNVKYAVLGTKGAGESRNIIVEHCEMQNDPGSDPFVDYEGQKVTKTSGQDTGAGVLIYGNYALHDTIVRFNVCTGLARIVLTGSEARNWTVCSNRSDGAEDSSIYVKGTQSVVTWNHVINSGKCGIKTRPNGNRNTQMGGHRIAFNYVEEFGLIKPDSGACINIAVPTIVEYNTCKVLKFPAAKSPTGHARCYNYASPFIISRHNVAITKDDHKFRAWQIHDKSVFLDSLDDQTVYSDD
jgi:hypothetical protein